jgi:hypothetical protein
MRQQDDYTDIAVDIDDTAPDAEEEVTNSFVIEGIPLDIDDIAPDAEDEVANSLAIEAGEDDEGSGDGEVPVSSALTFAAVAKLKVKAMRWRRPSIEDFRHMSQRRFHAFVLKAGPEILRESALGPTSMKHASWHGSDNVSAKIPTIICVSTTVILATTLGVWIGFGVDRSMAVVWGVGSTFLFLGASFVIFMTCLIIYMLSYSNGLQKPPMPWCVDMLGFVRNMRANIVCRFFLMGGYIGCCNIVGLVMQGEADDALKRIKKLRNGQGPEPGGVCWIGDSEFTFWHHLPGDMKEFHPNCFNAGFGGSRLVDIQNNVERLCLDFDPATVIVHAGGNDFDFDPNLVAQDMPARLIRLFKTIAGHPSVKRVGYLLSSRRPVYSDEKWDFMVRVHSLTIDEIRRSNLNVQVFDLRDMVHPLQDFCIDRVHLNTEGHSRKAQKLLPRMLAVWGSV